jgi:hypothetical protein
MPDICALLCTYIHALPEPVLNPALFDLLWVRCVRPCVDESDSPHASIDHAQITTTQTLLLRLPTPNLSLFIYLCAFFTQIPLSPENGLSFEDIARVFAFSLLGGPSKARAQQMLVWILRRWARISEGLTVPISTSCSARLPISNDAARDRWPSAPNPLLEPLRLCANDESTAFPASKEDLLLPSARLFTSALHDDAVGDKNNDDGCSLSSSLACESIRTLYSNHF